MGLTGTWMKPFPNNYFILNNYRTDKRIRGCSSKGGSSKFKTPLHHSVIKGGPVTRRR
jgi:hypothetical protein